MLVLRQKLSDPVFLLAVVAALGAFVVQSGELGSSDTTHRLQVAHSFWTSEPPVFPQEYPEFGLHGRGGKLQSWYGMGQSLLLLPADIIGTYIERLPIFAHYNGNDPAVRSIVVSFITNILVNVLTALIAFRFLCQLGFNTNHAVAGVLALLFCTTHLHYTQNMMENNYIMLLTLVGFSFQFQWLSTGSSRALVIGSVALGLNLLTRLTTGLDLLASGVFLLLALLFEQRGASVLPGFRIYIKIAIPVYAIFGLIDRFYQFYRFGSFTNTYVTIFAQEYHRLDPSLPPNYPWETPFRIGFLGPLITAEKSIFPFDPLLVLTILVTVLAWKRFSPQIRAYVLTAFLLLLGYIAFYAKYTVWSGDFAWGDRYVSTAAKLAAFISVPLLLRNRLQLIKPNLISRIILLVIGALMPIPLRVIWHLPEIYQMETLGHPTFVIALRFKNIVAFALGKMDQWGLTNHAMMEDDWDYVHITTWIFLPFLLRGVGEAPAWVVRITLIVWGISIVAFAGTIWRLARLLRRQI